MKRDANKWAPSNWVSSNRQGETLADDLQLLLGDLCKAWGFCSILVDDLLDDGETITADDFARRLLIAEGFPSDDLPINWRQKMAKVFEARYGKSTSRVQFNDNGID
ncbi:MAG: hypothetical protein ABJ239_03865 [Erythrobacter sp.]